MDLRKIMQINEIKQYIKANFPEYINKEFPINDDTDIEQAYELIKSPDDTNFLTECTGPIYKLGDLLNASFKDINDRIIAKAFTYCINRLNVITNHLKIVWIPELPPEPFRWDKYEHKLFPMSINEPFKFRLNHITYRKDKSVLYIRIHTVIQTNNLSTLHEINKTLIHKLSKYRIPVILYRQLINKYRKEIKQIIYETLNPYLLT